MADMDDLFSQFMNDVNSLKSDKMKKLEAKLATPEEIVERLTSKTITSPFEILGINPDMPDEQIAKHYRKMSILIHPDKCKHPKARDAFQMLGDAFNQLKDPSVKEKYAGVIERARERVKNERMKENVALKKAGKDPLDLEGKDFEQAVMATCEDMLSGNNEKADYAERTRQTNEARLKNTAVTAMSAKHEENMKKRKWEKTRDQRVVGWRAFLHNVEGKEFKTKTHGNVGQVAAGNKHHKKEENTKSEDWKNGPAGLQREWKDTWR